MVKKIVIVVAAFALVFATVFGVGMAVGKDVGLPQAITAESACPPTGCASGECHGFENIPEPDGVHEMDCPEASCSSVECHAWDSLRTGYRQASDASLNLWILAPVVLVVGLVLIVRKVR
ncbi:MAG TPA: hypothetical protein IAA69_07550 [Candidatus Aveggerthella stercoripullorum]|uniref:Uncharacterized protein n=1 Tax=Candidatus Aveggerthella stercoripullorum TaxID=2840688 RepID=A0A9D1A389_9ACTN|nr:hypothetical protein [Candidatus Aveggerthella stercoripullorum]